MRQFLYVSRTKVEVLEADLSRWRRPRVSAAVSVPGVRFNITPPAGDPDLYRRANVLIRNMERRKHIVPMPEDGQLRNSCFYRDQSGWAQGLYSFKGDFSLDGDGARVVTYLLWRCWQDSIILLAGSPENVLGERVIRGGIWAYGTTGTWATLLHFAEAALHTDETNIVGIASPSDRPEAGDLRWMDPDIVQADIQEEPLPSEMIDSPRAVALGALCLGRLSNLPTGQIETAFRVFQRLPLTLRGDIPSWVAELLTESRDKVDVLRQCKMIYVGSPLYTALR
jgi:hypothetical protein